VAWALDGTAWPICGTASVCVARQYTGTAAKVPNRQVEVSLNLSPTPRRVRAGGLAVVRPAALRPGQR
jgi:hypothetical protein